MTSRPIRKESHMNPSWQEANWTQQVQTQMEFKKSAVIKPKLSEQQTALTNEAGKTSADASFRFVLFVFTLRCGTERRSSASQSLVSTPLWWLGKRDRPAPAMFVCLPGTDMLPASQFLVFSNFPQTIQRFAPHTVTPETKS